MNKTEKILVLGIVIVALALIIVFCFFIRVIDCPECLFGVRPFLSFSSLPCWDCDGTGEITIAQWIQDSFFIG